MEREREREWLTLERAVMCQDTHSPDTYTHCKKVVGKTSICHMSLARFRHFPLIHHESLFHSVYSHEKPSEISTFEHLAPPCQNIRHIVKSVELWWQRRETLL